MVIAGAGSGKTLVLVERFLALLDADPQLPLNAIAAITFTEKAAAEMRERVRAGIQARANGEDAFGSARWAARLAAMDSARIGTIHSLCAAILRANAAEAGVDPAFDVLDEIESRLLLEAAIDDALRDADAAETVGAAGALLAVYDGGGVRSALLRLAASDPLPADEPAALLDAWQRDWGRGALEVVARFRAWLAGSAFAAWTHPIPDGDKIGDVWRTCVELLIPHPLTPDTEAPHPLTPSPTRGEGEEARGLLEAIAGAVVLKGGSAKAWGGDDVFKAAKAALTELRTAAKEALDAIGDPPGEIDKTAAALIERWAALAGRAHREYLTAKAARGGLDFDDLERLTAHLLQDDEVRARYAGDEIRAVLVDEFQDTNATQWQIVRALTEGRPGALFVVGDPKQSIYAFRGADVTVFKDVAAGIVDAGGARVELAESFRTHSALVDAFNRLFPRLLTADSRYAVDYGAAMEAKRQPPVDAPPLECLLIEKAPTGAKDEDEGSAREREAAEIAERLRRLIEEERRQVFDRALKADRPARYGDIAVLFQAMTNAAIYEAAFKSAGLPYVTVAGRGFYDRQEIWDALNLLRAVYNPGDDLAVASALRSPLFALSDDALLWMRHDPHPLTLDTEAPHPLTPSPTRGEGEGRGEKMTFWDCLYAAPLERLSDDDRAAVLFARETLDHLRALAGRVSIADLLREAYASTGYLAVLTGLPGGVRLRANAEKLVAIAEATGQAALGAFLEILDNLKAQESREGEAALDAEDAVKLMTVHKSKGLEFPVVVLADASYRFGGGRESAYAACDPEVGWSCRVYDEVSAGYVDSFAARRRKAITAQKEDAEKRRLLYVAATRAADLLILSGQIRWDKDGALRTSGWLTWLIEALALGDLAPEEIERDTPAGRLALRVGLYAVPDAPKQASANRERALPTERFAALDWELLTPPAAPDDGVEAPPLVGAVRLDQRAVRDLTATQIGDLGAAVYALPEGDRPFFRERWARAVYGRAPAPIETVSDKPRRSRARLIGEIVHRAIQYGIPDGRGDLPRLLAGYAWGEGVTDPAESAEIVDEAARMLERVRRREVFGWLGTARRFFRELPFVSVTPERTIHGILDLLIERPDGSWAVVDFKTARVPGATRAQVEQHARRYHLQVGVYALAVEQLLGVVPSVYLDYIQHDTLVHVPEPIWREALARLEEHIGALFGDEAK
ncbi:MAG: UvrD-helicase domain-containing protein [Anaerolineae bacterium]|nr:UvrD-helicase domain-containing protein [Anaerolineae bacterium]